MCELAVVIPFYNSNRYLEEALSSVFTAQKQFKIDVVIVVDKNSEAPLVDERFRDKVRVMYNTSQYSGAGVCRAIGFNGSHGRYIFFLDADDLMMEDRFAVQLIEMQRRGLAFSFGAFQHFAAEDRMYKPIIPKGIFSLENFYKKKFTIGCLTVCVDKRAVPLVPTIAIKKRNDYLMWDFIIKTCVKGNFVWGAIDSQVLIGSHRLHEGSLTSSRFSSSLYYFRFLRRSGNSLLLSVYYFFHYCLNTVGTR